jgi:hypothetical protein
MNFSLIFLRVLYRSVKYYDRRPTALIRLWRKASCVFWSSLKIHCPRPSLNPRNRCAMASTLLIFWLIDYVGWDLCLRTAAITGLLFIPRENVRVRAVVMMMPAGDNSWLVVYQSSVAVLPAKKKEQWTKKWEFRVFSFFDTSTDLLHDLKS